MASSATLHALRRLIDIMERLRSDDGCPWDARQTPQSLKPYLIEETHEVLDALDRDDHRAVCEELGDLLLQIVFQARIFEEQRSFNLGDVANSIADKLVRRHPHVFGGAKVGSMHELDAQWEAIKAAEKKSRGDSTSPLERIPKSLPALSRAIKILEILEPQANIPSRSVLHELVDTVHGQTIGGGEEGMCSATDTAIGELLLAAVKLARAVGCQPEDALQQSVDHMIKTKPRV